MTSASNHSELQEKQIIEISGFPLNLFQLRNYDGFRIATLFIFLLSLSFFVIGLFDSKHWWNFIPILGSLFDALGFFWRFLLLTISYCLLWVSFDTKGFLGYAMGTFTVIFGLIYIISPLDFDPDVIPLLGTLDDGIIGGLSILLGALSLMQTQSQSKNYNRALKALRDGKQQEALRFLLEDRGVELE